MPTDEFEFIDASGLEALLLGDQRFALFDARDEGLFAKSHMLFACSLSLADLEARLFRLVPWQRTLIVLTSDEGDGMAARAARRCLALGYTNLRLLRGGNQAWQRHGKSLFKGIHVPSKAFGELVEAHYHTPMIEAAELHGLMASGAKVRIFDCRPPNEFHRMSLPTARNCPGADLLSRVPAMVDHDETIVINCAGRTRGILGAQSLISAGVRNRVVALKNGTMGWHLAGFPLESGRSDLVEPVDPARLDGIRRMAANLRERFDIAVVDMSAWLSRAEGEPANRPLLLDVRGPWEYQAGHLSGSRSAPGGQLLQATDYYVAVRNTPLLLADDDGIRASITAAWLLQMGLRDVSVLDHRDISSHMTESGTACWFPARLIPPVDTVDVPQLARDLEGGTTLVLDLGSSDDYYKGHIPRSRFVMRSRLAHSVPALPRLPCVTLVADDAVTGAFAAREISELYGAPVRLLQGGRQAWREAGLPMQTGLEDAVDPPEDMWHIPSSPLGGLDSAMRDYLSWEIDLAAQVAREPGTRYLVGDRPPASPRTPEAPTPANAAGSRN